MSSSFIGEIRAFPYDFAPQGWLECDGSQYLIRDFQALFAVIANTYGGSYVNNTFKVPDLRGTAAMMFGSIPPNTPKTIGTRSGNESVTLNSSTAPSHTHAFNGATGSPNLRIASPVNNNSFLTNIGYKASGSTTIAAALAYLDQPVSPVLLNPASVSPSPNSSSVLPHENRSPFLVIRYCICATEGDFPVNN